MSKDAGREGTGASYRLSLFSVFERSTYVALKLTRACDQKLVGTAVSPSVSTQERARVRALGWIWAGRFFVVFTYNRDFAKSGSAFRLRRRAPSVWDEGSRYFFCETCVRISNAGSRKLGGFLGAVLTLKTAGCRALGHLWACWIALSFSLSLSLSLCARREASKTHSGGAVPTRCRQTGLSGLWSANLSFIWYAEACRCFGITNRARWQLATCCGLGLNFGGRPCRVRLGPFSSGWFSEGRSGRETGSGTIRTLRKTFELKGNPAGGTAALAARCLEILGGSQVREDPPGKAVRQAEDSLADPPMRFPGLLVRSRFGWDTVEPWASLRPAQAEAEY